MKNPKIPISYGDQEQIRKLKEYTPTHKIRVLTATSLFDGHDASINIMRRLMQARGAEVIHLGHNRTAKEVADAAIQEDVQAIALSSYQGGHMEYFRYIRDLLNDNGGSHIKIFGGGGGVITPNEIVELERLGITKIYSPEDGQEIGLEGIIGHILAESDFEIRDWGDTQESPTFALSRALTLLENGTKSSEELAKAVNVGNRRFASIPVLGITGTGGAGKSSLIDELLLRFLYDFPEMRIALLCIDPSKKKTGGALLGDRIRINACADDRIFLRSFASRGSGQELSQITRGALELLRKQDFDFIIVETSGIGQGNTGILDVSDCSLYVMTPEYGAQSQLEKIDMLDYADLIALNKYERPQGPDSVRDLRTLLRRNRYGGEERAAEDYPIFGTIASRFNDDGTNGLFRALVAKIDSLVDDRTYEAQAERPYAAVSSNRDSLIPANRQAYLAEISKAVRTYHKNTDRVCQAIADGDAAERTRSLLAKRQDSASENSMAAIIEDAWAGVDEDLKKQLDEWQALREEYRSGEVSYAVRKKTVKVSSDFESLSTMASIDMPRLPRVALPNFKSRAEIARFLRKENIPGRFPYTAGIFPFRRRGEDPKRQFAGEGGPKRTNKRFHFLSQSDKAKRLSTAFDSVTLYGSDPNKRPDIYGKVGESGVSIATLNDLKDLYAGFDLCSPSTSVSMTINGPAPVILAMFLNTAIDQQVDIFKDEHGRAPSQDEYREIADRTVTTVRGTVQADILKEDQAQNTCIFSSEFSLKLMGDVQEYFVDNQIRNYYAVSISGYHIAEAGANPISQLAFTLANGFTYVEYYLSRGMDIDDIAPNLSYFFSNGLDAEYAVMGRVARRIWAIAMRDIYAANEKSQKLKYHIQTSGRSLHAQEMDFNDIRTTLQALLALYDNCNSLHTNAYDEAVTTPTEESVRRAMAIQMIINEEYGPNKCENINQGSFFLDELTDLVEEAVLLEFDSLSSRGGVLGAMETQYQRSKIQEESLLYERLKHTGELPIIGVNTYLDPARGSDSGSREETELIRASYEEKDDQLNRLNGFHDANSKTSERYLQDLADAALDGRNVFAELMRTVRHCSLGQISEVLYRVGGRYRRSM